MKNFKFKIILIMQIIAFCTTLIANYINFIVKGEFILKESLLGHFIVLTCTLFALYIILPLMIKLGLLD